MLVPALILAATLHAGPERAITASVPNASPYRQLVGDIAADDDVALMVWLEESHLAAARVDRDGKRVDARPIALSSGPAYAEAGVARGSNNWLVVWSEAGAIMGRLVDENGVAGNPFIFAQLSSAVPRVAFDGTHYLVAWRASNAIISGARLTADGRLVEVKELARTDAYYLEFDLVALPSGFAIVTIRVANTNQFAVEALRLTTTAELYSYTWLDHTTSAQLYSLVALADVDTLVAMWGSTSGVFVAREHQPLRVVGRDMTVHDIVKIGRTVHLLLRVSQGNEVLLISEDGSQTRSMGTVPLATRFTSLAAASFGDRALVVTTQHTVVNVLSATEEDIRTRIVNELQQDLVLPERLAIEPSLQMSPAIARRTSTESLAVWTESGGEEPPMIVGVRVDHAGRPIDSTPIAVSPIVSRRARSEVASDGTGYLVVWSDPFTTVAHAAVIRPDGTVGPNAFLGGIRSLDVCAAWNSTDYFVGQIVAVEPGRFPRTAVQVTRVSRDGDPGAVLRVSAVGQHTSVSCASAGDKTLVAWSEVGTGISGTIVSADGTTIGEIPIGLGIYVGNAASNGERFAVAWDVSPGVVEWAVVSAEGTVSLVPERMLPGSRPHLAASRDGWVLAWEIGETALAAAALHSDGRRNGAPISLSDAPMRDEAVALASGDAPIAIYMRELETPLLSRWRVFTRTISDINPRRRAARH